ncbi:YhgE/Pip family protein [Sporosarcina sp. FA9]|uniref:YhgE/Pip family protein n=1 Tax=Sporosarcina sp. FA9 TaxID=3413030 RepID=UPI003F657B02
MKKSMVWAEWKQLLKTRKMIIPLIAILFIPVLYAGMFLWAFWNPYANMSDLPVAVVNLDNGAEMEGEQLALGKDLANNLVDSKQFDFTIVSKDKADQGLESQDYYVVIEIPENFSEHATTLLDKEPEKLTIVYKPNEGYNFLSAQIGETAMDRIRAEVNEQVTSTYVEKLFASITEMGDGFGDAADGAGELQDGARKLASGADELKGYLETLASSTIMLADGSQKLANGAKEASSGAQELNKGLDTLSIGSKELLSGAQKATAGASNLKTGITEYTDGVGKLTESYNQLNEKDKEFNTSVKTLNEKSQQLSGTTGQLSGVASELHAGLAGLTTQLAPILEGLPEEQKAAIGEALNQLEKGSAGLSTGMSDLSAGANGLAVGTEKLNGASEQLTTAKGQILAGLEKLNGSSTALRDGSDALATGNATLSEGLSTLSEGVTSANNGSSKLASGLVELTEGTDTLQNGTGTLASKSQDLAKGSITLADGIGELNKGAQTLQEKLAEANDTASEINPTEKNFEMAAAPVDVENAGINKVPNYGTGFAPYFISLGLFVGALLLSIVFPLVEPAIKPTGAFGWFLSKVSVLAVVGFLQAMIAVVVIKFALGMEVANMPLFIITAIITSYTFIAIVQMFVSLFSDAGRFMAIIVLILQLTTSAGTFPLELIPAPLQIFNKLLPMTYSVQAFKASISTGDTSFLWTNNAILLTFIIGSLAITFGYFALLYKKRHSKELVEA